MIVYGRNDSHGYSLHKRATLSLNALASVLDDPDDEILFVDYNSPDEVPTFPETIADTPTAQARERVRVTRVRPQYHRGFARRTSLVALEPQSRNIAARRSNPRNRWLLSTNTDMVFLDTDGANSLSRVFARLEDGFYHLPRFELPESLWERANRADPEAYIDMLRQAARRFHLSEIVYGGFDNTYEGPGDFQLFLRDDYFKIAGFDERMILGCHADSNVARRMKLLRGEVLTAFPLLHGYHCGHTRQATSLHGARRVENSQQTFVREVAEARWAPDGDWGASEEDFEEIRLTEPLFPVYWRALEQAIETPGSEYSEASYHPDTFGKVGFDGDHVLPHLLDVLFNMPPGQQVFVVASNSDLVRGLARGLAALPSSVSVTFCAEYSSPGWEASGAMHSGPVALLEVGLAAADCVVIQYPNVRTAPFNRLSDLSWFAQYALERLVRLERERPSTEPRRIIVVNGTHNALQIVVADSTDAAAMPYSTRIRHGRVVDPRFLSHPPVAAGSPEQCLRTRWGGAKRWRQRNGSCCRRLHWQPRGSATGGGRGPAWWRFVVRELVALAKAPQFAISQVGLAP